jgi:hypothetical protein
VRRRIAFQFVIIAAVLALSLAQPAAAQNLHYGMNTQADLHAVSAPMLDKLAELGAGVLRLPFGWDVIEPSCKGCFDWTITDRWRDEARRTHRTIFASLGYTARWANGGRDYSYPPLNDQDWYDFVFAVVSRYKNDITLWGIWNEPNLDAYLHGGDLATYQRLVVTATLAIRAASPAARILGPEVSHHALKDGWFAAAMDAVGDRFDIVTFHWYHDGPPLAFALDELVRPYARGRDVWMTEVGLKPCGTIYGDIGQALLYNQVLSAFLDRRAWWTGVIFYDLYELPRANDCGWAIVNSDWSNRPAFSLLQAFIKAVP